MSDDNNDFEDYNIPDMAPAAPQVPSWAYGNSEQKREFGALKTIQIPEVTKDMVIGQLYLEAVDRTSRNQGARVKALATIALIKGWVKVPDKDDIPKQDTNNVTAEEAKTVANAFDEQY